MTSNPTDLTNDETTSRKRSGGVKPLKLIALALTIAALIKELRLPKDARTWNGVVVGFVPYDFRKPTIERMKGAFWDPEGSVIVGRPFGVGWTLNIGAIVGKVRGSAPAA